MLLLVRSVVSLMFLGSILSASVASADLMKLRAEVRLGANNFAGATVITFDSALNGFGEWEIMVNNYVLAPGAVLNLSATSNNPGAVDEGFIISSKASLTNTDTGGSVAYSIAFISEDFSLPLSPVSVTSDYTANSSTTTNSTIGVSSLIDTTTIGSFTVPPDHTATIPNFVLVGGLYDLANRFSLTAGPKVGSKNGVADADIATRVTHRVPEAWNFVTATATFIPVGLLYFGLRRRAGNNLNSGNPVR